MLALVVWQLLTNLSCSRSTIPDLQGHTINRTYRFARCAHTPPKGQQSNRHAFKSNHQQFPAWGEVMTFGELLQNKSAAKSHIHPEAGNSREFNVNNWREEIEGEDLTWRH